MTAKPNCILRITWLKMSMSPVADSPIIVMTKMAGITANNRVMMRRNQGAMRRCKYPSITIWPASVPVTVLLCPAAMSAMANKTGA